MDDTSLAYLNDPAQRQYMTDQGLKGDDLHLHFIKVFNHALTRKPAGMTFGIHLCRGNFRSSWVATGGYDYVADALFNQLNVDGYFLEFDDERSGGFEPLRYVPKGKKVVLGLVTSKRPELESREAIKRRLDEASYAQAYRTVGLPRLRGHQIGLIHRVGQGLGTALRMPKVGSLLRFSRLPAKAAGFGELQGFLERGFDAFAQLGDIDGFLDQIDRSERAISRRLFAGEADPFRR
jgi:hypothetical protein